MKLDGVLGVQYNSRRVRAGDCFVAMRGGSADGNLYVDRAVAAGAVLVVSDSREAVDAGRARWPRVRFEYAEHGRRALAEIASEVYGHPERRLKVSAITGTNGKTTTAWLLEQMLRSAGHKCVLLGTIETHVGDEVRVSEHTTPEASDLYKLFADGVAAGCTEVVMEMSSHALAQERVWGVPVDIAIFTNLTQDHLDFHESMEAYGAAKARLFEGVGAAPPRVSMINGDDAFATKLEDLALKAGSQVWRYGWETAGDWSPEFRPEQIMLSAGKTQFEWVTSRGRLSVETPLTGRVNLYNWQAAACAALARGLSLSEIAQASRQLRQVPGRFETVPNDRGFAVVVDYAHTDDALRNLIALGRELVRADGGRVITVFGCGGDRDRTKRPKMGRAAGAGSNLVVLTSDNPRSEQPAAILDEALVGVRATSAECLVIEDRAEAIAAAIGQAQAGDIVLIAGKGHEKVQILRDGTVSFDDVAVAMAVLAG